MGFENLKYDFPKMPEEMRAMIEKEVNNQVNAKRPQLKGTKTVGRTVAASLAAVLLCGTTVFAGAGIYRMQQQKTGAHGVDINISDNRDTKGDAAENTAGGAAKKEASIRIPEVKMEVGYLPEGMVQTEQAKFSFQDALNQGGVSMAFYRMDTGDDKFEVHHKDVLASEEFTAQGNQGIYLEYPDLYEGEITFNKRIYVSFTDVHYVMEMYAASDVSKEEAVKIAKSVKLIPAEKEEGAELVTAENWSTRGEREEGYLEEDAPAIFVAKEKVNIHQTGDSFSTGTPGLTAKVSDVKVSDDISLLDDGLVDEDFRKEVDENGKLRPAVIQYIKRGDTDSLSQEVKSRTVPQKLVYAAVEYTNTSSEEMKDVLFFGELVRMEEADGKMHIVTEEKPEADDNWDAAVNHGLSRFQEMPYYDVHGGERGNNYITSIKPGETAVVHMAWVVTEEELEKMYISLNTSGGGEFSDDSLKIGYVDVRQ